MYTQVAGTVPVMGENKRSNGTPKSQFKRTVCLAEWWLTKPQNDGGGVAVAGLTSREQQAVRLFSSAPILKSHDLLTLETTDGLCILLKGFINRERTTENGFPDEVFCHFVFGFPPYWKELIEKCMGGDSHVSSSKSKMESQNKKLAIGMTNSNKSKASPAINLVSDAASDGIEMKFHSSVSTVIDLGSPLTCLSENLRNSAAVDKSFSDSYNHDSGAVLFSCSLYNENSGAKVSNNHKTSRNIKRIKSFVTRSHNMPHDADNQERTVQVDTLDSSKSDDVFVEKKGKKSSEALNQDRNHKTGEDIKKIRSFVMRSQSRPRDADKMEQTAPIDTLILSKLDATQVEEKGKEISEDLNQDKNHKTSRNIKSIKRCLTRSQNRPSDADNKEHAVSINTFGLSKLDAAFEEEKGKEISDALKQVTNHKTKRNIKSIKHYLTRSQSRPRDAENKEHAVSIDTLDFSKLDAAFEDDKGKEIPDALNQDTNHKSKRNIKKIISFVMSPDADNKEHTVPVDTLDPDKLDANFAEAKGALISEALNHDKNHKTCGNIKMIQRSVTRSQNRQRDANNKEQTVTTDALDSSQLDAKFVEEKDKEIVEALNQEKNHKTCRIIKKKISPVTSSQNRPCDADNKEHTVPNSTSFSENDVTSNWKSGRRLSGRESPANKRSVPWKGVCQETPIKRKNISHVSPESLSLNRSRSGRLLMPTLKFWFNERATYDVGGTIIGIHCEDAEHSISGGKSTTQRKRMQLP